jgi:hypothetical protein
MYFLSQEYLVKKLSKHLRFAILTKYQLTSHYARVSLYHLLVFLSLYTWQLHARNVSSSAHCAVRGAPLFQDAVAQVYV